MNLYSLLRSEGVDLDALPFESAEPAPRQQFQFTQPDGAQSPRAPADFDKVFQDAGDAYGVDPYILKSIAFAESRFRPEIISGKVRSPAGAIGLMQFMPDTAKEYGIDPTNPVEAIFGAAAYMRESLDKFGGDYGKAVASYNAGRNRKSFEAEDWDLRLPAETQKYVQTVFSAVTGFKDGGAEVPAPRAETQATPLPPGVTTSKAGGGRGSVSPGMVNTKLPRTAVPEMTAASVAQDVLSGALQISPIAVKGVGELIRLATGDRLGKGVTDFAERGIKATQDLSVQTAQQHNARTLQPTWPTTAWGLALRLPTTKAHWPTRSSQPSAACSSLLVWRVQQENWLLSARLHKV
jgi:hypothetical protein